MNQRLELFLTKFIFIQKWRKILRKEIKKGTVFTVYDKLFGDYKKMLSPCEKNVKIYDDYIEVFGIKFKKMSELGGVGESFGRRDYEFGGIKNCVFVDVGANIGDSALYAASQPHMDCVYAYEPFPSTFDYLKSNIALNAELEKKIFAFPYGWGGENKEMEISYCDDINVSAVNSVCDFFNEKQEHVRAKQTKLSIKNSSEILSSLLEKHQDKNFVLKLDIEGAEYEVLENLNKNGLLAKVDIVILEWHYRGYKQITEMLEQNGFVWFHEVLDKDFGLLRAYNKRKG